MCGLLRFSLRVEPRESWDSSSEGDLRILGCMVDYGVSCFVSAQQQAGIAANEVAP